MGVEYVSASIEVKLEHFITRFQAVEGRCLKFAPLGCRWTAESLLVCNFKFSEAKVASQYS